MQSAVMMLNYLGETTAANNLLAAIQAVYKESKVLTGDVGGSATTTQFTDAVIEKLAPEKR
jgi:isocitrate dehydrogenase (NAD+)